MWTHYTTIFVLLTQAAWALWTRRDHLRALLIADAAAVVLFLPWIPGYIEQSQNPGVDYFDQVFDFSPPLLLEFPLRTLVGHPFRDLPHVPGVIGLVLILCAVVLVLLAAWHPPALPGWARAGARSEAGLVVLLALACPLGLLLYNAVGTDLFVARNFSASEPGLMVTLGLVVAWLSAARFGALVLAVGSVALVAVAVGGITGDSRRPPYVDAAHYLDRHAGARPVVETPVLFGPDARLRSSTLSMYAHRPLHLFTAGPGDSAAWRAVQAGHTAYSVDVVQPSLLKDLGIERLPAVTKTRLQRLGGPDGLEVRRASRRFAGFDPVVVSRYRGRRSGRLEGGRITWSLGSDVAVRPAAARGAVESFTASPRPALRGWATTTDRRGLVDWILLFSGSHLVAASAGGLPHAPAPGARELAAVSAGFALTPLARPSRGARVRAFALIGRRATELPISPAASIALQGH